MWRGSIGQHPRMTVINVFPENSGDGKVVCFWFGKNWQPCVYAFDPMFLERI